MRANKKTILVVDDDESIRVMLKATLESEGYRVFEAKSGNEALALLDSFRVDLVLTDVEMENGNGFELLRALRKAHPEFPPVVFATGHAHITEKQAQSHGALALFRKPFDVNRLLGWVEDFLE